jgi:two-component system sensor histidine kinase RegB
VVAREIARELPEGSPLAEDVALLSSQTDRCRDILADLARRPETDGGEPYERLALRQLVEAAAAPHLGADITFTVETVGEGPEPVGRRRPELLHGLGLLLQNAMQHARGKVHVTGGWDDDIVRLTIADDGPGFAPGVLARLGEPYVSGRGAEGEHMGLGIFIAATLLEHTGAVLDFDNARPRSKAGARSGGAGALVAVAWPRHMFESKGESS